MFAPLLCHLDRAQPRRLRSTQLRVSTPLRKSCRPRPQSKEGTLTPSNGLVRGSPARTDPVRGRRRRTSPRPANAARDPATTDRPRLPASGPRRALALLSAHYATTSPFLRHFDPARSRRRGTTHLCHCSCLCWWRSQKLMFIYSFFCWFSLC